MAAKLQKGDKVVGNSKNAQTSGRAGTVTHVVGNDCWVRFDDTNAIEGGIHVWFFDVAS